MPKPANIVESGTLRSGFSLLVSGSSVFAYGTYLNLLTLGLFTYQLTGSATGTGVLMAVRLGAGFLAGLAAGRLVAVAGRRNLMIGANLTQAATLLMLAAAPGVPVLCVVAVVLGAGNTVFVVAVRGGVPELVGHEDLARANGRLVTGRALATVVGLGSAGVLVGAAGFGTAFLVSAASFVVSAMTVALVPVPRSRSVREGSGTAATGALWRLLPPVLVAMLLLRGADALGSAAHNVGLPVFAGTSIPDNPAGFMALFMATWAAGNMLAHQILSRLSSTVHDHRLLAGATCVMSVCFVLVFTGIATPLLVLVSLLAGLADGTAEILHVSRLQATSGAVRDRLFGLSASVETSGFAVGMLTSSALLETLPVVVVVGVFHSVAIVAAVTLLALAGRSHRDVHGEANSP